MTAADIIIYGFDYTSTEHIIDSYIRNSVDFSSSYVDEGVHREDRLLCHLRVGRDIKSPCVFRGRADILHARTWEDAGKYFEWIKESGTIRITDTNGCEEDKYNIRMKEFILRQERAGIVKVVHSNANMI